MIGDTVFILFGSLPIAALALRCWMGGNESTTKAAEESGAIRAG